MIKRQRDLRETPLFAELRSALEKSLKPGTGAVVGADGLSVSPDGKAVAFAGALLEKLDGMPTSRICTLDLESRSLRVLTFGPNIDRAPAWVENGERIAFLSDREQPGNFQLYLADVARGETARGPNVDGWIEYLHPSPDGAQLLLGVAGFGADMSGAQGSATAPRVEDVEPWMPEVESGEPPNARRSAWLVNLASGDARKVSPDDLNVWEACWCGPDRIAVVASAGASEADWYSATLQLIEIAGGAAKTLHTPQDQLGWPAGSPNGGKVAVVAAVCSDRWVVAGDLWVIDTDNSDAHRVDTKGVDVTDIHWLSDDELSYTGHRSFETVYGRHVLEKAQTEERFATRTYTWGDLRYPVIAPLPGSDRCVVVRESFTEPAAIALLSPQGADAIHRFLPADADWLPNGTSSRPAKWRAPDDLEIHGWVVTPPGEGPFPLVMDVHGGPVWQWRHRFLGKGGHHKALLERGCALFFPNPRGSSGRGQAYARTVFGDMGGADTGDYLSGLDALIEQGVADPKRIGVTGGSYGGFMTNWLITQDPRFAAAVAVASIGNWVSEHLVCNIPHFCEQFLDDDYRNLSGKYFSRSPIYFADRVKTPCLNIAGALDKCTPPNQDKEFYQALQLNSVESALVVYPQEGHGPRRFPAIIDYSARVVDWFATHLQLEPAR